MQQGPFPKLEPGATKPIYSGDQGALELEKIRTSQQAQIDAANKVKESVESVNQKFREQVELLTTLREKGRITGEEYEKAMKKAKEEATHTNSAWRELGKAVSEDDLRLELTVEQVRDLVAKAPSVDAAVDDERPGAETVGVEHLLHAL